MKRIGNRLLNIALTLGALMIIGFIASYYFSYWSTATAQATINDSPDLPANHPDISKIKNLHFPAEGKYCLACHQGIEPTRPLDSEMMKQILAKGTEMGDPNGCVVCHGGTPNETVNKHKAHSGVPRNSSLAAFTPVPGALQVNDNTCGLCHTDHTYNVHRSIMNTDAGKMKAIAWSFGIGTENKDHVYADHDIDDPDGPEPRFGSAKYKEYMKEMAATFPGQYPKELKQIPQVSLDKLGTMPEQIGRAHV